METLFKELATYGLAGWMIFVIVIIFTLGYILRVPISKIKLQRDWKKSNRQDRNIKELLNHDIFNTLSHSKNKVKNMRFYTHGKFDSVKTKMCYDFTVCKTKVCSDRFEKFLNIDFSKMNVDELKNSILDEISEMHIDYINDVSAHWLNKGLHPADVEYIVELFERFRFDVVHSFKTRIDAIFSASYYDSNFKKMLACFDVFAMGVDLLPNDMRTTFESLNGRFADLDYK